MMRFQSTSCAVSCTTKRALPPICCTVSSPPGWLMSVTITVAPSSASSFAVARPMPDPAPVTSTTLSATLLMRSFPIFLVAKLEAAQACHKTRRTS